ncbi:MAG: thiolase [Chloroflexi bacterium]|nr:thiolase [Chloroflexota bacterium]
MPARRATRKDRSIAIVGAAESDELGLVPNKSSLQHHAEAAYNALDDAGLSKKDVDGLFTAGFSTLVAGEYLGIQPTFTDSTSVGGSSFVIHVAHAIAAIQAGYCEVALVTHGQAGRSRRAPAPPDQNLPNQEYEVPFGIIGPPVSYSLACTRYMHQYGEERTRQGMAEVAVATRKWALKNPKAFMKDPMTFDDYHSSRWVSWPFHLPDCCLVTDAGAAVVVTTAERAAACRKKPVWVLGAGESHDHSQISTMPDLTITPAAVSGRRALDRAGLTHKDINHVMIYDSFTYTVLVTLESLGFCGRGEAPDFVKGQRTAPGGAFPLNTSGGGLSYTHPGMYGIFLLVEAVRQLRGEAGDRQVPGIKTSLVNGTGGSLSSTGTVVLAVE